MAVVTLQQVQAWLESTKLTLSAYDAELELVAQTQVFAAVAGQYDVSGWADNTSTPALISEIISMLIASWTYRRQYSEDSDADNWYAIWLEGKANSILDAILGGTLALVGGTPLAGDGAGSPSFYPNDNTEFDETGSEIKFAMGSVY